MLVREISCQEVSRNFGRWEILLETLGNSREEERRGGDD